MSNDKKLMVTRGNPAIKIIIIIKTSKMINGQISTICHPLAKIAPMNLMIKIIQTIRNRITKLVCKCILDRYQTIKPIFFGLVISIQDHHSSQTKGLLPNILEKEIKQPH
ncbi:hypothetical protein BpHYR1_034148 [Brachionus plicatilis]|uniref:Uncharacterized protein n=1 Tax=Brachionus plicatilis TaxID=10195 RepID=A0A3M7S6B0_BRAPC|nr:hypothetical protein BpHYR1_034148 [Brachionus plicatilis]